MLNFAYFCYFSGNDGNCGFCEKGQDLAKFSNSHDFYGILSTFLLVFKGFLHISANDDFMLKFYEMRVQFIEF